MKIRILTLLLILGIFTITSCNNNECADVICSIGTVNLSFDVVDKISSENLFANGTFDVNQLLITNTLNDYPVYYSIYSDII